MPKTGISLGMLKQVLNSYWDVRQFTGCFEPEVKKEMREMDVLVNLKDEQIRRKSKNQIRSINAGNLTGVEPKVKLEKKEEDYPQSRKRERGSSVQW